MVLPPCYQDYSCTFKSIFDFYGSAMISPGLIFLMLLGSIMVALYVRTKTVYFIPPMIIIIAFILQGEFQEFNNIIGKFAILALIITAITIAVILIKLRHE